MIKDAHNEADSTRESLSYIRLEYAGTIAAHITYSVAETIQYCVLLALALTLQEALAIYCVIIVTMLTAGISIVRHNSNRQAGAEMRKAIVNLSEEPDNQTTIIQMFHEIARARRRLLIFSYGFRSATLNKVAWPCAIVAICALRTAA